MDRGHEEPIVQGSSSYESLNLKIDILSFRSYEECKNNLLKRFAYTLFIVIFLIVSIIVVTASKKDNSLPLLAMIIALASSAFTNFATITFFCAIRNIPEVLVRIAHNIQHSVDEEPIVGAITS